MSCDPAGFRPPSTLAAGLALVAALLAPSGNTAAQLGEIFKGLDAPPTARGEARIGAGLREALKIGTENAVLQTGRTDGFFANQAIKILLPAQLRAIETPLRFVGYGPQLDEFVLSMNRAAEKAVPFAKEIFWEAIGEMTFEDARSILQGSDTAATDYFRAKTSKKLYAAFRPTVERAMKETNVVRRYEDLLARYREIPFTESISFDINRYVTEKTIDGLFYVVAQEERKIRTDPAARVTGLLKEVFGGRK
ncbi:MAG TPA: DUF4197 domain-containing protein [candidate division Zixibacteria bacterium]|nr:DUF4197 domain-containing protein [candidate division Zixibacteria bacterium]